MPDERTQFVVVLRTGQLVQFDWTIGALDEANIPHLDSQETAGGLVTAPVFPSTGPGTWWSVAVPADMLEQAREVLSRVPGEITTEPDVWDFRPKPGVALGWKIVIVTGLLAPICLLFWLLLLPRVGLRKRPDAAYWFNAGVSHRSAKHYRSAMGCFDASLRLNPKLAKTWLARGLCRIDMLDYTNAVMDLQYASNLEPTNHYALIHLAWTQAKLGQFQPALDNYNRAWKLDTNNIDVFKGRGRVFEKMGRFDGAIAEFDHCLAINPSDAYSLRIRAYCLVRTNKFEEAIATYTQALVIEPESAEAYDGRGYAHQLHDEWELAAADYERALRIQPAFGSSLFGLAEYCFQKGAYVDAWRFVRKAEKARTVVPAEFLKKLKSAMLEPREESVQPRL